jgi:hypothetical protein
MAKPMANNVPQAELFAGIAADAGIPFMMENPRRLLAGHPNSRCKSFACA